MRLENQAELEGTATRILKETEGARRVLEGIWHPLFKGVGIVMVVYHIAVLIFRPTDPWVFRSMHVLFASVLAFALVPARQRSTHTRPTAWDLSLILASIGVVTYLFTNFDGLIFRAGVMPERGDVFAGAALLVIVLEMARRTGGMILPLIGLLFIGYALAGPYLPGLLRHRGYDLGRILSFLFSTNGIYGVAVNASAVYVYLFVVFGAFVEASGASKLSWTCRWRWPDVPGAVRRRCPFSAVPCLGPFRDPRWPTSWWMVSSISP